jgi:hypothetical protein
MRDPPGSDPLCHCHIHLFYLGKVSGNWSE